MRPRRGIQVLFRRLVNSDELGGDSIKGGTGSKGRCSE